MPNRQTRARVKAPKVARHGAVMGEMSLLGVGGNEVQTRGYTRPPTPRGREQMTGTGVTAKAVRYATEPQATKCHAMPCAMLSLLGQ